MSEPVCGISREEQEREIPILEKRIIEIIRDSSHNALSQPEIEEGFDKGPLCPLWQTQHKVPLIGWKFRSSRPRARSYFVSIALAELIKEGKLKTLMGGYTISGKR